MASVPLAGLPGRRLRLWRRRARHGSPRPSGQVSELGGVGYGGSVLVVVEINVNRGLVVRPDPREVIDPPAQGPGSVPWPWIRRALVEPQVAPVRRPPQWRYRAAEPIGQAQRGAVSREHLLCLLGPPGRVAWLDRHLDVAGRRVEGR